MILIVDGNLEIGTHVWSEINSSICSRYSFRSTAVKIYIKKIVSIYASATCSELPYNISIMCTYNQQIITE